MLFDDMKVLVLFSALVFPSAVFALDCEYLGEEFKKYDVALSNIEGASFIDNSAPRESNRQAAVANILARKSMVLDMMIYMECDMPEMVEFSPIGVIGSNRSP